jgi:outer membrane protein TolC
MTPLLAASQCSQRMDSLPAKAACISHDLPSPPVAELDSQRRYRLDELVDLAERNNPNTRIAWERARQASDHLHVARSAYYPELTLLAFFGDERMISPFPKPLAPRGYTMAEVPTVAPAIGLEYALFDSGHRSSIVEKSAAARLAAAAAFERTNQQVALAVVRGYYDLITADQRLAAAQQILTTAKTTEDAAQAQLEQGRATLPDVLNARAARAQAAFDLEDAIGSARIARVALRESLGIEPSDQIEVTAPLQQPDAGEITATIESLVDSALVERPDLQQLSEEVHAADAAVRAARAEQMPSVELTAKLGQTAMWPTSDYGTLGSADQTTWSVGVNVRWSLFDGGRRSREVALARSEARQRQDEVLEQRDRTRREVWTAYLTARTALRQRDAAVTLLQAAETSYNATFEAYQYGVKNLIDVVTAEQQLAKARLAHVQANSAVWISAVQLEYATGSLLRARRTSDVTEPAARRQEP